MTKTEFAGFIREHGPVILDGATGTNLMEAGMPIGVCPESWVLENPQVLLDLQRRYVEAGSHIVYASTFTGNRIKLEEYGLQERLEEINTQLVALSRQAVGDQALVAGDMTMTGQQLFPMGELLFEELVDVYKEQASVLAKAGVDLFVVETMMSLQLVFLCLDTLYAGTEYHVLSAVFGIFGIAQHCGNESLDTICPPDRVL